MLTCDSLRKKQYNDLSIKDSVSKQLKIQIAAYSAIVAIKDSTNKSLKSMVEKESKKDKSFSSPITWIIAVATLFLGISIGK
jgi:hypothetical protein